MTGEEGSPEVSTNDQREQRVGKLARLRDGGVEPFASRFDRSESIAAALARHDALEAAAGGATTAGATSDSAAPEVRTDAVRLAGRIMRHRGQGKVGFADISDESGSIQVFLRVDALGEDVMRHFEELDLGDIIGVEGPVFRTRRGQQSVEVQRLELLTKALRPLPDKWHGLRDPELRYRQRHVDLIVNPEAARILRLRSALTRHIRNHLEGLGFVEVETPVLNRLAGGAAARPFLTRHNALGSDLTMRIALELHLKRLVVGGLERVFEIGRVFRNEGIDAWHNPEFTILEVYEAYSDYTSMMVLVEGLLKSAAVELLGGEALTYQGEVIDLSGDWPRREMLDLVQEALPALNLEDLAALRAKAGELGATRMESLDWGEAIFELFERTVEPNLRRPTFVTGFPLSVSPLARRRRDDPRLVERFELLVGGHELGDAFSELTDPIDQRARFEQQLRARAAGAQETHPMDEDFIAALEQGMPPTSGLGIGIDRLAMLFADAANIREVIAFPLLREVD